MFKEVPAGGDTVNGLYVPGGTGIGWSAFGLMRNKKVWGDDAKLFRPERWLEGSAEEIRKREIDVEMVFGYGKYQCLGKNVASLELNKVFVEVSGSNSLSTLWQTSNVNISSCAISSSQL
jgi:cytochrome P450